MFANAAWFRCATHSFTHCSSVALIWSSGGAGKRKALLDGITQVFHLPAPGST